MRQLLYHACMTLTGTVYRPNVHYRALLTRYTAMYAPGWVVMSTGCGGRVQDGYGTCTVPVLYCSDRFRLFSRVLRPVLAGSGEALTMADPWSLTHARNAVSCTDPTLRSIRLLDRHKLHVSLRCLSGMGFNSLEAYGGPC